MLIKTTHACIHRPSLARQRASACSSAAPHLGVRMKQSPPPPSPYGGATISSAIKDLEGGQEEDSRLLSTSPRSAASFQRAHSTSEVRGRQALRQAPRCCI